MAAQSIAGKPFFCSFSGGKDSCLALYHALKEGGRPGYLFTMLTEDGERSRSHGLPLSLIRQQSDALAIPLITRSASWRGYEEAFVSALFELREAGVDTGVFGDIDIEDHRAWCRRVCSDAGMLAFHPLWKRERSALLEEFIRLGFSATIIAVKDGTLDTDFLGQRLDSRTIKEMGHAGVDASGELGEYHTVVTGGPIFSRAIELRARGKVLRDGYWFLDVSGTLA